MGYKVFISHAAPDKAVADAITTILEQSDIPCWVAPRNIRPGDTWGSSIVKAIEASEIMIVVFSSHANKSRQVVREVERGIQKNLVVLPFRIEEEEPSQDMEYFLSATHWLDAISPGMDNHLLRLLNTVQSILKRPAPIRKLEPKGNIETEAALTLEPSTNLNDEIESVSGLEFAAVLDFISQANSGAPLPGCQIKAQNSTIGNLVDLIIEPDQAHSISLATTAVSTKAWIVTGFLVTTMLIAGAWSISGKAEYLKNVLSASKPLEAKETTDALFSNQAGIRTKKNEIAAVDRTLLNDVSEEQIEARLKIPIKAEQNTELTRSIDFEQELEANRLDEIKEIKLATREKLVQRAENGDREAQYQLGLISLKESNKPKDEIEALKWFSLAAAQEHPRAQAELGYIYERGKGVPINFDQAVKWYRLSAAQQDARAQSLLGAMYQSGKGVALDYTEAANWYRLAAAQQDREAQNNLAIMYELGIGVPKDNSKSMKWYRLAAEQGDTNAQKYLNLLLEKIDNSLVE